MNFVNLAHGAFAMAGGYVTVLLMDRAGLPFLWTLPLAFLGPALLGRGAGTNAVPPPVRAQPPRPGCCSRSASSSWPWPRWTTWSARSSRSSSCPTWLQGRFDIEWVGIGKYRLFIIVVCAALTIALQWVLSRTRFGSRLRAAVDDPRVASGLGINVNQVFTLTFAVGSGLAGPGRRDGRRGAGPGPELPAQVHDLFPDRRPRSAARPPSRGRCWPRCCWASPTWAGKYYVPQLGAFIVYTLMVVILFFRPQGLFGRAATR